MTGAEMQQTELRPCARRPITWRRTLLAALCIAVLALVFAAYLQPAFMLDLANRFILCL